MHNHQTNQTNQEETAVPSCCKWGCNECEPQCSRMVHFCNAERPCTLPPWFLHQPACTSEIHFCDPGLHNPSLYVPGLYNPSRPCSMPENERVCIPDFHFCSASWPCTLIPQNEEDDSECGSDSHICSASRPCTFPQNDEDEPKCYRCQKEIPGSLLAADSFIECELCEQQYCFKCIEKTCPTIPNGIATRREHCHLPIRPRPVIA